MDQKLYKTALLLFFVSVVYSVSMNVLNVHSIRKANPTNKCLNARSLAYDVTVYSIDNYWYLNHVKNYLATGKFTVDTTKYRYEVRRTPVYPLFYGAHYLLFGEKEAMFIFVTHKHSCLHWQLCCCFLLFIILPKIKKSE